jgi:hypothetical protein
MPWNPCRAAVVQGTHRARQAIGMEDETQRVIRERAYALWEAEGRPKGRALEHWRQAEREVLEEYQSVAGEEDPLVGLDEEPPGGWVPQG